VHSRDGKGYFRYSYASPAYCYLPYRCLTADGVLLSSVALRSVFFNLPSLPVLCVWLQGFPFLMANPSIRKARRHLQDKDLKLNSAPVHQSTSSACVEVGP